MTALHFFYYPNEHFISLCCSGFLIFDSGFVEKVQIFQSLMKLHDSIYSQKRLRITLPTSIRIGQGGWVNLGMLDVVSIEWYFFVGGRIVERWHST